MTKNTAAVIVNNVTKTFKIPTEASNGIKQRLINILKRKSGYREFTPLKGINLEIKQGDFFGIVGRNGSGKSTLLKTIANIYTPTSGSVSVNGRLVPFIELGVGFNPELTGRENIYLNCALLGFSHSEVDLMYEDIVAFSEIGDFMEEKLKNYSSGMQVRLAFSIAIKAQGDILLLDEVLAVGDEAFQRKCFEYFAQLKKDKKTVILVSHDMSSVARFCNKAALIDSGKVIASGNIKKVIRGYEKLNEQKQPSNQKSKKEKEDTTKGSIKVFLNESTQSTVSVKASEKLNFSINVHPKEDMKDIFLGFTIQKSSGEYVYWYTTEDSKVIDRLQNDMPRDLSISMQNIFGNGEYTVNVNIKKTDRSVDYIIVRDAVRFTVSGWNHKYGWMYHPSITVKEIK